MPGGCLPSANGREALATVPIVAYGSGTDFAPAMAGQGKQIDADHELGVQPGGSSQSPAAQGSFLALDFEGMAGGGGPDCPIHRVDGLLICLTRRFHPGTSVRF